MKFPDDPVDNQIYEDSLGRAFIYRSSDKSWTELLGGKDGLLASSVNDGMMTAEDFSKLSSIFAPPPITTLQIGEFGPKFTNGVITITAGIDIEEDYTSFVEVATQSELINGDDKQTVTKKISDSFYDIDLTIDDAKLFEYLVQKGQLRVVDVPGPMGSRGGEGLPGDDEIKHGPPGDIGEPGANSPISFSVRPNSLGRAEANTAFVITDLQTASYDDDDHRLVVHRKALGIPDYAVNNVILNSDTNSKWLVVIPRTINRTGGTECNDYDGPIYYLDIEPILDGIRQEFYNQVDRLKRSHESTVAWWIEVMSGLLESQKSALCCALEYCKSRKRNQNERRYIESSRIAAAAASSQLIIDSDPKQSEGCSLSVTAMQSIHGPQYFGADGINMLPTNADQLGGGMCVPVTTIVDGQIFKYEDCPPGFTPIGVYRANAQQNFDRGLYEPPGSTPSTPSIVSASILDVQNESVHKYTHQTESAFTITNNGDILIDDAAIESADVNTIRVSTEQAEQLSGKILHNHNASQDVKVRVVGIVDGQDINSPDVASNVIDGLMSFTSDPKIVNIHSDFRAGQIVVIESQNATIVGGNDEDRYINGNRYARRTVFDCVNDLDKVTVRIEPKIPFYPPYNAQLGATGPQVSFVDPRYCTYPSDPIHPDVISASFDPNPFIINDILVCHVGDGNYRTAIDLDDSTWIISIVVDDENVTMKIVDDKSRQVGYSSGSIDNFTIKTGNDIRKVIIRAANNGPIPISPVSDDIILVAGAFITDDNKMIDVSPGTYFVNVHSNDATVKGQPITSITVHYSNGSASSRMSSNSSTTIKHSGGWVAVTYDGVDTNEIIGTCNVRLTQNVEIRTLPTPSNYDCTIHHKQLRWMEQQFKIGNYKGCIINDVDGRSLVFTVPGVHDSVDCLDDETAITWPVMGDELVGIPNAGDIRLKQVANDLLRFRKAIKRGDFRKANGDISSIKNIYHSMS